MRFRQKSLSLAGAVAVTGSALLGLAFFTSAFSPASAPPNRRFDITVENLTAGQIFSPLVVAVHDSGTHMFQTSHPASAGLALLAEDGDGSLLAASLMGNMHVDDVQLGTGAIPPHQSETIRVSGARGHSEFSLAAMMISTNDVFVGIDGVELPRRGTLTLYAYAYDAGSEFNSEDCAFIPGPPCMGGGGVHDPQPAEGYVHISPGIQGVGTLSSSVRDWRGPVAKITVRRAH